jgi:hypothetical protein
MFFRALGWTGVNHFLKAWYKFQWIHHRVKLVIIFLPHVKPSCGQMTDAKKHGLPLLLKQLNF